MSPNIESCIRCYNKLVKNTLDSYPPEEPTSEITPSLAALDDAPALKQKEWKRGDPGEDILQQYSTISGNLTLTPHRCEDMRMDLT